MPLSPHEGRNAKNGKTKITQKILEATGAKDRSVHEIVAKKSQGDIKIPEKEGPQEVDIPGRRGADQKPGGEKEFKREQRACRINGMGVLKSYFCFRRFTSRWGHFLKKGYPILSKIIEGSRRGL